MLLFLETKHRNDYLYQKSKIIFLAVLQKKFEYIVTAVNVLYNV